MRVAHDPADLGVVQPLIDAWDARGEVAQRNVNDVRGDPADVLLRHRLDRDVVESEFDLGPLVSWLPGGDGWELVDSWSGTRIYSHRDATTAVAGPEQVPAPGARARVGYADQVPDLRDATWRPPAPDVEVARVAAADRHVPAEWRFVEVGDVDDLLARCTDVLGAVLPGLAAGSSPAELEARLPGWFRERCAPAYAAVSGAPHWPLPAPGPRGQDLAAGRVQRWATSWSATAWLEAIRPAERLWAWESSIRVSPTVLLVGFSRPTWGAPVGSLKWLLHACGAVGCVPPAYAVDDAGRRVQTRPPPPTTTPEPWTLGRFARLFRTPGSGESR